MKYAIILLSILMVACTNLPPIPSTPGPSVKNNTSNITPGPYVPPVKNNTPTTGPKVTTPAEKSLEELLSLMEVNAETTANTVAGLWMVLDKYKKVEGETVYIVVVGVTRKFAGSSIAYFKKEVMVRFPDGNVSLILDKGQVNSTSELNTFCDNECSLDFEQPCIVNCRTGYTNLCRANSTTPCYNYCNNQTVIDCVPTCEVAGSSDCETSCSTGNPPQNVYQTCYSGCLDRGNRLCMTHCVDDSRPNCESECQADYISDCTKNLYPQCAPKCAVFPQYVNCTAKCDITLQVIAVYR